MMYDHKKILLIMGLVLVPYLSFAGTGPSPSSFDEGFYITSDIGTSTTVISYFLPFPTGSAPWIGVYDQPSFAISIYESSTDHCYYGGNNAHLDSTSGDYALASGTMEIARTTGTISAYFYPWEGSVNASSNFATIVANCKTFIASSSDWSNSYWDKDVLNLGIQSSTYGGETLKDEELTFDYPYNGGVFSDVSNWVLDLSGAVPGKSYQIRVAWEEYQTSTSNPPSQLGFDDTFFVAESATENNIVIWKKNPYGMDWRSSSTIKAYAMITDSSYDYNFEELRNSDFITEIEFTYTYGASDNDTSTESNLAGPFDRVVKEANALAFIDCDMNTNTWTESIAYGFCLLSEKLLNPTRWSTVWIEQRFNAFKTVFPFSIFYELNSSIDNAQENIGTNSSLSFEYTIANQTTSIMVSSDTFLIDIFGIELVNLIWNMILVSFGLSLTLMLYKLIITL